VAALEMVGLPVGPVTTERVGMGFLQLELRYQLIKVILFLEAVELLVLIHFSVVAVGDLLGIFLPQRQTVRLVPLDMYL
jgi:hypothetical protein